MTLNPLLVKDITTEPNSKRFTWVQFSPRVGQIQAESFRTVTYLQFPSHDEAFRFFQWITETHGLRCQVRKSERFPTGWECKIWGMNDELLVKLVEKDRCRLILKHDRFDYPKYPASLQAEALLAA